MLKLSISRLLFPTIADAPPPPGTPPWPPYEAMRAARVAAAWRSFLPGLLASE